MQRICVKHFQFKIFLKCSRENNRNMNKIYHLDISKSIVKDIKLKSISNIREFVKVENIRQARLLDLTAKFGVKTMQR